MTDRSDYSSRDYAREAEATRKRLASSINELSDRLTPGQVFDEMLTYARGGGGTFFRALSNAARENPIPSLLIGAGCMLFLSEKTGLNRLVAGSGDGSSNGRLHEASDAVSGTVERAAGATASAAKAAAGSVKSGVERGTGFVSDQASNVAEGVRRGAAAATDAITSASEQVRETASNVGGRLASATEQMKEGAKKAGETIGEYSTSLATQVSDAASAGSLQARRTAKQVKSKAQSLIHEQPLLFAAVGIAVGALLAATLPKTETEDELMGEASDAVKGAVGDIASEQYQAAKDAAGRVVEQAKDVAAQQGLTPAAAADAVRNVGEKLKAVVSETAATAQTEAKDLASTRT